MLLILFLSISGGFECSPNISCGSVDAFLPEGSSICKKYGPPHLDITGKISVDLKALCALQSWFILTQKSSMWGYVRLVLVCIAQWS